MSDIQFEMPDLSFLDELKSSGHSGREAERDSVEELNGIRIGFVERAKREKARFELVTDSEYWFAACFQTRDQKEKFLKALGIIADGDKYIDGTKLADRLGIDIGPLVEFPQTRKIDKKLVALAANPEKEV